jgi:hypothetical protein
VKALSGSDSRARFDRNTALSPHSGRSSRRVPSADKLRLNPLPSALCSALPPVRDFSVSGSDGASPATRGLQGSPGLDSAIDSAPAVSLSQLARTGKLACTGRHPQCRKRGNQESSRGAPRWRPEPLRSASNWRRPLPSAGVERGVDGGAFARPAGAGSSRTPDSRIIRAGVDAGASTRRATRRRRPSLTSRSPLGLALPVRQITRVIMPPRRSLRPAMRNAGPPEHALACRSWPARPACPPRAKAV